MTATCPECVKGTWHTEHNAPRQVFEARGGKLHLGVPDGPWHMTTACGRRYSWDGVTYPGARVTCRGCASR